MPRMPEPGVNSAKIATSARATAPHLISMRRCEFLSYGQVRCAFPAEAYVNNDCGGAGWYCRDHIELFSEQAQRRVAIKRRLLSLWHLIRA